MILISIFVFDVSMSKIFYGTAMPVILFFSVKILLDRFDERFTIKEDKVALEHGILHKKSTQMSIRQIRTIKVEQKIWQRILNIGDIFIGSAATGDYEIIAHGIINPHNIKENLQRNKSDSSQKKKPQPSEIDEPQEESKKQE